MPNGFFWYNCKFYHQKIEKYTLSLFNFSLVGGFFEGIRENILQIFRAQYSFGAIEGQDISVLTGFTRC